MKETGLTQSVIEKSAGRWRAAGGAAARPGAVTTQTEAARRAIEHRELTDLRQKKTLFNIVGEDVMAAVVALNPPTTRQPIKKKKKAQHDPEEIVVMLGDMHIGSLVDQGESGGLGAYGMTIFGQRLEFFKTSIAEILNIHLPATPCPAINLFFLGDIVDGAQIFPGHQRQVEIHAVRQVIEAVDSLAGFVGWLAESMGVQVNAYCVVGNHGRIGRKGEESPLNNFDYLVYHFMKERLSRFENIEFFISESWWMLAERMGHRFYLTHGDDTRGWMGLPYYGLKRSADRGQRLMNDAGANFRYYCAAHFHQTAKIDDGRILLNGAWPGGSEFSLKSLKTASEPSQAMFAIHPKYGVTWERTVLLDEPREKNEVKVKVYK